MANYPKELEDLLQDCLTDGIITPQERQVLLRKAESMGVDPAEYDLHITNEEQKLEQSNRAAAAKVKGRACPYCGSSIPQLADKCPNCNKAINVQADSELEEIIDHLEEALIEFKSGKDFDKSKANVERYIRKAEMYYGSNPKIQVLLEQVKKESELAEAKAKKKATWNTIGKILTYNKWLTAGVILALIIGIGALVTSITDAVRGDDPTYNAAACISEINKAIEKGDLTKAESLYNNFKEGKAKLGSSQLDLAKAYVKTGEVEKAANLVKYSYAAKEQLAKILLKEGYYNEAWKMDGGYEEACEIIDAMRENGDDAKIEPFVNKTRDYFGDHSTSNYWKLREYAGLK